MASKTRQLIAWLYEAPDMARAVGTLTNDELLRVSGLLSQDFDESGRSGELLGVCLVERSDRWGRIMETAKDDQRNAGGGK
jgi:hypothetical protein